MFSSSAAFYADANEQLNNSFLNESVWDPSVYYPPIETSTGVYYDNYWNVYEYCYAPVYYGFQYYPEQYQPFVANTYGEFPNDYQTVYYYSQVFYDIYYYPVDVHFVPVIYYPVSFVPVTYSAIDVPYQHNEVHDLSDLNDVQCATLQNRVGILTNFTAHEAVSAEETTFEIFYEEDGERVNDAPFNNDDKKEMDNSKRDGILTHFSEYEAVSAEMTTFEVYYEEDGERLNDAPFNNDDKKENNDNQSTSCSSEGMCKEESCVEVFDSDYECAILDLCSKFEKLSLHDDEAKSSSSKPNDNSGEDPSRKSDDNSVEDLSSKSDDSRVEDSSCNSDDNSSDDSSSSGSYEVNYTAIKREGNIMDLHHIDDYTHSDFDTSPSSGDKNIITEENSEVECEVHELSGQSYIDMIVSSEEYLSIQENLKHAKLYKDYLYRESLKNNPRSEKSTLFDVLPTIEEESYPLMDDTPIESEDEISMQDPMIVSPEMISSIEDEPVTSKTKQPKQRFKAFKKWLSSTFCCCCSTKDPP